MSACAAYVQTSQAYVFGAKNVRPLILLVVAEKGRRRTHPSLGELTLISMSVQPMQSRHCHCNEHSELMHVAPRGTATEKDERSLSHVVAQASPRWLDREHRQKGSQREHIDKRQTLDRRSTSDFGGVRRTLANPDSRRREHARWTAKTEAFGIGGVLRGLGEP